MAEKGHTVFYFALEELSTIPKISLLPSCVDVANKIVFTYFRSMYHLLLKLNTVSTWSVHPTLIIVDSIDLFIDQSLGDRVNALGIAALHNCLLYFNKDKEPNKLCYSLTNLNIHEPNIIEQFFTERDSIIPNAFILNNTLQGIIQQL